MRSAVRPFAARSVVRRRRFGCGIGCVVVRFARTVSLSTTRRRSAGLIDLRRRRLGRNGWLRLRRRFRSCRLGSWRRRLGSRSFGCGRWRRLGGLSLWRRWRLSDGLGGRRRCGGRRWRVRRLRVFELLFRLFVSVRCFRRGLGCRLGRRLWRFGLGDAQRGRNGCCASLAAERQRRGGRAQRPSQNSCRT